VIACAAGTLIGITMYFSRHSLTSDPTIEAFVTANLVYRVLEKLRAGPALSAEVDPSGFYALKF
jgi:hypothetical protein